MSKHKWEYWGDVTGVYERCRECGATRHYLTPYNKHVYVNAIGVLRHGVPECKPAEEYWGKSYWQNRFVEK